MKNLKVNIRKMRKARGLRQCDLARITGVNQSSICHIETGKTKIPSIKTLAKIAEGLNTTIAELSKAPVKKVHDISMDELRKEYEPEIRETKYEVKVNPVFGKRLDEEPKIPTLEEVLKPKPAKALKPIKEEKAVQMHVRKNGDVILLTDEGRLFALEQGAGWDQLGTPDYNSFK